MQYFKTHKATGLLLALALFTGGMQTALAVGTASGTTISNTATVDYQVSGAGQPTVTSNNVDVLVDNRVDLTVTNTGGASVVPNSTDQAVPFTVTNDGNTTQGYSLTPANLGGDDFDMANLEIYIENGTTVGFQSGEDTLYTPGNNAFDLAADATSVVVYVVSDTPITATNGQVANVTLLATTLDAGTTNVTTETAGPNNPGPTPDVVFGDGTGTAVADIARDGEHSATGTYTVAVNPVALVKSAVVAEDPFNGTTDPKAIPGARITYTLVVTNPGAAANDATNVVVVDAPPANTTYVPNSTTLNAGAQADGTVWDGTNVTVSVGTLAPGASATITFDVTIN